MALAARDSSRSTRKMMSVAETSRDDSYVARIIVSPRRAQAPAEKCLRSAMATGAGTIPSISPPNWATSLARLLER